MRNLRWISILVLLFGISIIIRLPFLNRPLGGHQWLTAQTLLIHSIWNDRGIVSCDFNPIVTFGLPTDKNIVSPMGRMESANGDRHFISQPPFGYIFPYIVLTSIGLLPDVLPIQIFNLVVYLICVLILFFTIRKLAVDRGVSNAGLPALVGAAVYIFMPVTLQYHGNVYSFEMLVQMFFLLTVFLILHAIERPNFPAWLYALITTAAFCMSYTEWLGTLFAFSIILYWLFHFRDKSLRRAAFAVAMGTAAALLLTLVQYSQIAGLKEFLYRFISTYLERSGLNSTFSHHDQSILSIHAWQRLGSHYLYSFGWFLAVFALAAIANAKTISRLISTERVVIWLTVVPILLHHLLLFDFTSIHDYSVLKDTIFLSIFTGMLFYFLPDSPIAVFTPVKNIFNITLFVILICALLFGVNQYRNQNRNSTSDCFQKSGRSIAAIAKPDEVVFADFNDSELCAQETYYAHRNIALYKNDQSARELIRKNGAARGIIFDLDEDYNCTGYRYLE